MQCSHALVFVGKQLFMLFWDSGFQIERIGFKVKFVENIHVLVVTSTVADAYYVVTTTFLCTFRYLELHLMEHRLTGVCLPFMK